jgi:lycopene epsilon-cyclase
MGPITTGRDTPFVNNYGVWEDEFAALGLQDTLDRTWDDAACWFGEAQEVRVGRRYGRVCRRRLRSALLKRCAVACMYAPILCCCLVICDDQ